MPSGDRWIDEIKFDGYRVRLHIHNDQGAYPLRQRPDQTLQQDRGRRLPDQRRQRAIIDGEVVVPAAIEISGVGYKAEALANVRLAKQTQQEDEEIQSTPQHQAEVEASPPGRRQHVPNTFKTQGDHFQGLREPFS